MTCKRGQSPRYLRPFRSSNNGKFPANAPLCPGRGGGECGGLHWLLHYLYVIRDFTIYDGGDENVVSKYNFAPSVKSLSQIFHLVHVLRFGRSILRKIGTCGFGVKIENDRFAFVHSRCRQKLKFGDFTSLLCRAPHENVLKRVPHVQHDYSVFLF